MYAHPYALALDPARPDTVYVGGEETEASVVYRTVNGGGTWTRLSTPTVAGTVLGITVTPGNPSRVYIAATSGLYRSDDFCASWMHLAPGIGSCEHLAFDPLDPERAWLATSGQGVYESTDGGSTWNPINYCLGDNSVHRLAVSPGDYLFAATDGGGVCRLSLELGTGRGQSPPGGTAVLVSPNPVCSGPATVAFMLPESCTASVSVFDLSGRLVRRLIEGGMDAGLHEVSWCMTYGGGRPAAPGVYIVRLEQDRGSSASALVTVLD